MKIAISSTGRELSDNVSEFFGRCPYFIVAEIQDGQVVKTEAIKNSNENQNSGAGIAAAQFLVENNVKVAIAKTIGPRAMDVLRQFNIEIYNGEGVVKEVLQKFINEKSSN